MCISTTLRQTLDFYDQPNTNLAQVSHFQRPRFAATFTEVTVACSGGNSGFSHPGGIQGWGVPVTALRQPVKLELGETSEYPPPPRQILPLAATSLHILDIRHSSQG